MQQPLEEYFNQVHCNDQLLSFYFQKYEKRSSAREHVRQKLKEQASLSAAADVDEPLSSDYPVSGEGVKVTGSRRRLARKPLVHFNLPNNVAASSPTEKTGENPMEEEDEALLQQGTPSQKKKNTGGVGEMSDEIGLTVKEIKLEGLSQSPGLTPAKKQKMKQKCDINQSSLADTNFPVNVIAQPEIQCVSAEVSDVVSAYPALDSLDDFDIIGSSQSSEKSPANRSGSLFVGRKKLTVSRLKKHSPPERVRKGALIKSGSPDLIQSDADLKDVKVHKLGSPKKDANLCNLKQPVVGSVRSHDEQSLLPASTKSSGESPTNIMTDNKGQIRVVHKVKEIVDIVSCSRAVVETDTNDLDGVNTTNLTEGINTNISTNEATHSLGGGPPAQDSASVTGESDSQDSCPIPDTQYLVDTKPKKSPVPPASGDSASVTAESDSQDSYPIPDTQYLVDNKPKKRKSLSKSRNVRKSNSRNSSPFKPPVIPSAYVDQNKAVPTSIENVSVKEKQLHAPGETVQSDVPQKDSEFSFENDLTIICGAGDNLPMDVRKQKSRTKADTIRPVASENNLILNNALLSKCKKSEKAARRSLDVCDYSILEDDDGDMYSQIKSRRSRRARHSWAGGSSEDLELSQAIKASMSMVESQVSETSVDTMDIDTQNSHTAGAGSVATCARIDSQPEDKKIGSKKWKNNCDYPNVESEETAIRLLFRKLLIHERDVDDFSLPNNEFGTLIKCKSSNEAKSTVQNNDNLKPVESHLLMLEGKICDFSLPDNEFGSLMEKHESSGAAVSSVETTSTGSGCEAVDAPLLQQESSCEAVHAPILQQESSCEGSQVTDNSVVVISSQGTMTWSESQSTQDSNPNIRRRAQARPTARRRGRGRGRGRGRSRKQSQSSHHSDISSTQSEESESLLSKGVPQEPVLPPDISEPELARSSKESSERPCKVPVSEVENLLASPREASVAPLISESSQPELSQSSSTSHSNTDVPTEKKHVTLADTTEKKHVTLVDTIQVNILTLVVLNSFGNILNNSIISQHELGVGGRS